MPCKFGTSTPNSISRFQWVLTHKGLGLNTEVGNKILTVLDQLVSHLYENKPLPPGVIVKGEGVTSKAFQATLQGVKEPVIIKIPKPLWSLAYRGGDRTMAHEVNALSAVPLSVGKSQHLVGVFRGKAPNPYDEPWIHALVTTLVEGEPPHPQLNPIRPEHLNHLFKIFGELDTHGVLHQDLILGNVLIQKHKPYGAGIIDYEYGLTFSPLDFIDHRNRPIDIVSSFFPVYANGENFIVNGLFDYFQHMKDAKISPREARTLFAQCLQAEAPYYEMLSQYYRQFYKESWDQFDPRIEGWIGFMNANHRDLPSGFTYPVSDLLFRWRNSNTYRQWKSMAEHNIQDGLRLMELKSHLYKKPSPILVNYEAQYYQIKYASKRAYDAGVRGDYPGQVLWNIALLTSCERYLQNINRSLETLRTTSENAPLKAYLRLQERSVEHWYLDKFQHWARGTLANVLKRPDLATASLDKLINAQVPERLYRALAQSDHHLPVSDIGQWLQDKQ